jgi:RNA polymerase sigma-54 factor
MRLDLTLRMSQKLAPQLIQSLKMLQMPVQKLEQVLRHELAINPLLEEIETQELEQESPQETELVSEPDSRKEEETVDWEDYLRDDGEYDGREYKSESKELPEFGVASEKSLYEYLLEQLSYLKLAGEDIEIAEFIIGNIDESGLLSCSVEELAAF